MKNLNQKHKLKMYINTYQNCLRTIKFQVELSKSGMQIIVY